jgi:hypothetical protein
MNESFTLVKWISKGLRHSVVWKFELICILDLECQFVKNLSVSQLPENEG